MKWARPIRVAASIAFLASCSSDAPPSASGSASPVASVAASPSSSVSAASAPPSAEPVAAGPKKTPPKTGRPSLRKWCDAPKVHYLSERWFGDGSLLPACAYIEVDDWIMVACPPSGNRGERDLGKYERAVPGGGSMATEDEIAVGPDPYAKDAVVISLRPGGKATPTFFYRPGEHPEWTREESFRFAMPEAAESLADREMPRSYKTEDRATDRCAELDAPAAPPSAATSADAPPPGGSMAFASPSAPGAEQPDGPVEIADIAGHPAPPDAAAWEAEREVMVSGSDALGCKTKLKDGWFRAVCEGKVGFREVVVDRGKHATQTTLTLEAGKLTLLTPYVDGTYLRARFTTDAGTRWLKLSWPGGKKRPYEVGTFGETR